MASENPRALLRAARKERRVTHPHASYTSNGNLLCNLCEVPIKSQAAWGAHLHSTGHTLRLSREQDAAIARKADTSNGKKRKAGSPEGDEGSDGEDRKRVKASDAEVVPPIQQTTMETVSAPAPAPVPERITKEDEADLDALEADLAAMERESRANAAIVSNTISAPPQTAEEIAAQAREEQSAQRGRRDIELEEEKEEAARALEEEFEEMQTLEERVKRLREKREMLRAGYVGQAMEGAKAAIGEQKSNGIVDLAQAEEQLSAHGGEDDDDEDDEEFDDWTFGAR